MKTVWVVEDGDYSDYRVTGVFTSEENADLISDKFGGRVSEWNLDPCVDDINAGRKVFDVFMEKDGTVNKVNVSDDFVIGVVSRFQGWFQMWARDKKHAVKIANEQRAQMIASGEWQ